MAGTNQTPPQPPRKEPLKTWSDWSAGVGYVVDDGETSGMSYASGLLGLNTELRVAPVFNSHTTGVDDVYTGWTLNATPPLGKGVAVMFAPASGSTITATGTDTSNAATAAACTASHTTPTMTNGIVVAVVLTDASRDVSGVTWDGDAMTEAAGSVLTNGVHIFYRVQGSGAGKTGNVVATLSGSADVVLYVLTLNGAHQTSPKASATSRSIALSSFPTFVSMECGTSAKNGMIIDGISCDTGTNGLTNMVADHLQTTLTVQTQSDLLAAVSRKPITVDTEKQAIYFYEESVTDDQNTAYLYVHYGHRIGGQTQLQKFDLDDDNFGANVTGGFESSYQIPIWPGQPVRYEGFWYIPRGNDNKFTKHSNISDHALGADTFDATATPFVPGADHLANLGAQVVGTVKQGVASQPGIGGIGAQTGGCRILIPGGDPVTAANWGPAFDAVDATERAAGLITLEGRTFVLNKDGLFSFNKDAAWSEVFSDFRQWPNPHRNIPMSLWYGGIIIPHSSGLMYYVPGERPVLIGPDSRVANWPVQPKGVTEMRAGIFHSTYVVGDFLYAIYQPDRSSTTVLVMVAYGEPPYDLVWQVLGTATLNDIELELGIFVSTLGRPVSANYTTPTLWFGNGSTIDHVVLGPKASPFRTRGDTHVVGTSGTAYMSELIFPEPVNLDELVVYTEDMASGDEWQFSIIADSTGNERNLGAPIRANGRHSRSIKWREVYRMTLGISFTGTDATARVPPHITMIELFGDPA